MADPPMIAVGDAVEGPYFIGAGHITWVDPDYDERTGEVLRPIPYHRMTATEIEARARLHELGWFY